MNYNLGSEESASCPMTVEQLWRAVVEERDTVYAPERAARVFVTTDGNINMISAKGHHTLDLASTDAARLHAHWQGFKE